MGVFSSAGCGIDCYELLFGGIETTIGCSGVCAVIGVVAGVTVVADGSAACDALVLVVVDWFVGSGCVVWGCAGVGAGVAAVDAVFVVSGAGVEDTTAVAGGCCEGGWAAGVDVDVDTGGVCVAGVVVVTGG